MDIFINNNNKNEEKEIMRLKKKNICAIIINQHFIQKYAKK